MGFIENPAEADAASVGRVCVPFYAVLICGRIKKQKVTPL